MKAFTFHKLGGYYRVRPNGVGVMAMIMSYALVMKEYILVSWYQFLLVSFPCSHPMYVNVTVPLRDRWEFASRSSCVAGFVIGVTNTEGSCHLHLSLRNKRNASPNKSLFRFAFGHKVLS